MIEIINCHTDEEATHAPADKEFIVREVTRLMYETFHKEGKPGDVAVLAFADITRDDGVPGIACFLSETDEIDEDEDLMFLVFGMAHEEWVALCPLAGDQVKH